MVFNNEPSTCMPSLERSIFDCDLQNFQSAFLTTFGLSVLLTSKFMQFILVPNAPKL